MNLVSLRFISRNPLSRDQRPLSRKYRVTGPDFSQNPPLSLSFSLSRSTHVSILFLLLLLLFVSKQRRRLTSPQSVDATCQFRANRMLIESCTRQFSTNFPYLSNESQRLRVNSSSPSHLPPTNLYLPRLHLRQTCSIRFDEYLLQIYTNSCIFIFPF